MSNKKLAYSTQHVIVATNLHRSRGEDVSVEDRALQVADRLKTTHDVHSSGYGLMSNFNVGSTVSQLEPEAVMTATCVVLSAASDVASLKLPDLTMHKVLASLQSIEDKLDQVLTTPLKMAIDGFDTVINAVLTGDFQRAFDQLHSLIRDSRQAFHYADKKNIGIESFR